MFVRLGWGRGRLEESLTLARSQTAGFLRITSAAPVVRDTRGGPSEAGPCKEPDQLRTTLLSKRELRLDYNDHDMPSKICLASWISRSVTSSITPTRTPSVHPAAEALGCAASLSVRLERRKSSPLVRLSARLMPPVGSSSNKNRGFPATAITISSHCLLVTRQRRCAVLRGAASGN